ncbi:NUDIX hydrolase [Mycolicibacterium sp.]|uniref:NUDIX hydrolase n=1 Tax=Mycolicibacterium sp. TaxID=2320850 RepID=UPI003D1006D2
MIPWVVAVVIAVLVSAVALVALWAYQTANRLDRLHVRYDLSWQALDGALARRAVVARAVAVDAYGGGPDGKRLAALADAAERAPRSARESAENELSAALALVDPASLPLALVAELADAEARVLLARRFHNDAVRDTLALRERPAVRILRLGGTAALPTYFEIAEGGDVSTREAVALTDRTSARVVLLDDDGAVLLLCGSDPAAGGPTPAPRWWFTIGGAAQQGETLAQTAARELEEETGLRVAPEAMVGPVWRREAVIDFNGSVIRSQEMYFVHRTTRFEPSDAGRTGLERTYIHGHRWCDARMIDELVADGEAVYPVQLRELLAEANTLADTPGAVVAQPQPIS